MTRFSMMLVAVVALAALPGLSGCLGGGGGSSAAPAAQMPREPAPAPMAEPAADPDPEPMAEPAADPEPMAEPAADPEPMAGPAPAPSPGSPPTGIVPLYTWGGGGWKVYDAIDLATAWPSAQPDGRGFGADEPPGTWSPLVAGAGILINPRALISPLPDGSGVRVTRPRDHTWDPEGEGNVTVFEKRGSGAVADYKADGAVVGRVTWDDGAEDNGRWSSWGWWLEYRGGDFIENAAKAFSEYCLSCTVGVAAFVDGPEFRALPASLPETGVGTYRGQASGVFASAVGSGGGANLGWNSFIPRSNAYQNKTPGSLYTGEFRAWANVTMTYGHSSGTDRMEADIVIGRMNGIRMDRATGEYETVVRTFERLEEHPAFRFRNSVSRSADSRGVAPVGFAHSIISGFEAGARASGSWEAQLSSVLGAGGHPRNVAGLFEAGVREQNAYHHFYGAFLAPLVTP